MQHLVQFPNKGRTEFKWVAERLMGAMDYKRSHNIKLPHHLLSQ